MLEFVDLFFNFFDEQLFLDDALRKFVVKSKELEI